MSKVLFPSLRIGYVVLPASLVAKFAALRTVLDDHGPLIDQATLAEFIEAGALHAHIRRCRNQYGERLASFVESASKLGLPLSFPHTDGGMNLAGFFNHVETAAPDSPAEQSAPRNLARDRNRGTAQDKKYSKRLQQNGLDVPPLSHYSLHPTRPGLVFGFTALQPQAIRESMRRVARALHHG
jgi:GntR family transcriptional regulator/MocR family aminotransferase